MGKAEASLAGRLDLASIGGPKPQLVGSNGILQRLSIRLERSGGAGFALYKQVRI